MVAAGEGDLVVNDQEALDGRWFQKMLDIKAFRLLSAVPVGGNEDVLFRAFMDARSVPEFDRSHIPEHRIQEAISQSMSLREQIIQEESEKSISELYVRKLDDICTTQRMLLAVCRGDTVTYELETSRRFGGFEQPHLSLVSMHTQEKTSAIGDTSPRGVSREEFERAKKLFPLQVLVVPARAEAYAAEEIADFWNRHLIETGSAWRAELSDSRSRTLLDARKRVVFLPRQLTVTAERARVLFTHEIGVHAARREAGKRSGLRLLGVGTGGSDATEEGLALMAEQLVLDSPIFRGVDKYWALVVAMGLLDGAPKNFSETFDTLHSFFLPRFQHRGDAALTLAARYAWGHTRSIFRHTDGKNAEMYFTRGKIYLEGNLSVWSFLATHRDEEFLRLFGGRCGLDDLPLLSKLRGLGMNAVAH